MMTFMFSQVGCVQVQFSQVECARGFYGRPTIKAWRVPTWPHGNLSLVRVVEIIIIKVYHLDHLDHHSSAILIILIIGQHHHSAMASNRLLFRWVLVVLLKMIIIIAIKITLTIILAV